MRLSKEQLENFERDGFLVIPNFFSMDEVSRMRKRAVELLESCTLADHPMTRFTTDEDQHVGDEYFLSSSDKVSFFFEDDAFDQSSKQLKVPLARAVNKIGHYLHELDPIFEPLSKSEKVKSVVESFKYRKPILLQSMLIFKQPKIGGKVSAHQDNTFLYTTPYSTLGFWFPLEDATLENGCLWFIPGSHRWPVQRYFKRNPKYFEHEDLKGCQGKAGEKAVAFEYASDYTPLPEEHSGYIPVEVKAGSTVLIHGSAVHKSHANTSDKSRFAYAFHIVDGAHDYHKENWLQMNDGKQFKTFLNAQIEGCLKQLPC